MSSNPATEPSRPGWLRRLRSPRAWSLRARLLVPLVSLLAVVCVGIGVGTEFALHRFLMGQLDEQVIDAGHRSARIYDLGPPPPPPPASAATAGSHGLRASATTLSFPGCRCRESTPRGSRWWRFSASSPA